LPGGKIVAGFTERYEIKLIDVDTDQIQLITRNYSAEKVKKADKEQYHSMLN
jgi:hypothetical protein